MIVLLYIWINQGVFVGVSIITHTMFVAVKYRLILAEMRVTDECNQQQNQWKVLYCHDYEAVKMFYRRNIIVLEVKIVS